jgi:hypothetical protein
VFDDRMIPEVRACSTPSCVNAPTGHTERTPEPCRESDLIYEAYYEAFRAELDQDQM